MKKKFAVIGAGIAGLTTALAFERKGIDYQVFEKAPELNEVGAGIWLAPNALQVLNSLNILKQVQESGNTIDRITLCKNDLSPLTDIDQDFTISTFGFSTIATHRARLQKILFDQIPRRKIQLNKEFIAYEIVNNEKLNVRFGDNTTIETDFLIGADGINSKVRMQLFPNSAIRYSGQTCWRGIANIKLDQEYHHRGMELWGNQIRFGISRISEGKVYWFAVALDKRNQKDHVGSTKQKLLRMFCSFHPMIKDIITATPQESMIRNDIIDLKPLKKWYKKKACLIGDAGHATTPNMGQGGAQAIEDAFYLSSIIEQQPSEAAFELFHQKRRKKVNSIVKQSWATGKMSHWKYGRSLRNLILKNIPKKFTERKMVELYRIEKPVS